MTFQKSTVVPAAEGRVKIDKDDNGNYSVNVKVNNLAKPSRLQPERKLYVVWMETENNGIKNLGRLKSSSGFFSDDLEGSLSTISPFKAKRVFITAENESNLQYPGSIVVLSTSDFN
ncbi:hypothetical protein I5M19_14820 [Mucilaginibacter sp. SD-g]|uniref:Uncharacterized protein n=1 Tax=Mucilaginibacter segetis TaxID=2793071 RepID=A0A934PW38_9SPHI|nr:hypothetical protein [Mucilaginibacter segetis]